MPNQIRAMGVLLALATLCWWCCSTSTLAEPPASRGCGCICAPSSHTYGYYPARWRRWSPQNIYGMPTPAEMSPQGEYSEEMPELLPPTNEDPTEGIPEGPATIPGTPSDEPRDFPSEAPEGPMPNVPDTAPPADTSPPNQPATEPTPAETDPMEPALPPPTLPDDPLAPPAESDDDPVPALPQSFRVPKSRSIPALVDAPRNTRTRRYVSPTPETRSDVDETGLPTLPSSGVSEAVRFKTVPPQAEEAAIDPTVEEMPELIEPSPAAQPLDEAAANKWTRHRQNPLRGGSVAVDREVQQAAHWQTPAPAEPAIAPVPAAKPRPARPSQVKPGRGNPLR